MKRNRKPLSSVGDQLMPRPKTPSDVDLAIKFGFDQGHKRGLVDGLRLHFNAKFGIEGVRLAHDAWNLNDAAILHEFMTKSWKMRSIERVRACLDEAFQKDKNTVARTA